MKTASRTTYLSILICLICPIGGWGQTILHSEGDAPGVQHWVAGAASLGSGECFLPIENESPEPVLAYVNAAVDFNDDASYAPYPGSSGTQEEWILTNLPIHVLPGEPYYHSGFFALTDTGAQNGSFNADFWISLTPLASVTPDQGDVTLVITMDTLDRDLIAPPNPNGPSGSPEIGSSGSFSSGRGPNAGGASRRLPDLKRQPNGSTECFITCVAMSMKWLESENPGMFGTALPANIDDLLDAMKATEEWQDHGIIRWGRLDAFKRTIFDQYDAKVRVHEWDGISDPFAFIKAEFEKGQDIEPSLRYGTGNRGHTLIITGWLQRDGMNFFKAVDPLEPSINNRQLDKTIKVTGTNTDYPGNTSFREINAESPLIPASVDDEGNVTWGSSSHPVSIFDLVPPNGGSLTFHWTDGTFVPGQPAEPHPEYEVFEETNDTGSTVSRRFHQPDDDSITDWTQTVTSASGASMVYGGNLQQDSPWRFEPLNELPLVPFRIPDLAPNTGDPTQTIYTAVNLDLYLTTNPNGFLDGDWAIGSTLEELALTITGGQMVDLEGIYWATSEFTFDPKSPTGWVPVNGDKGWLDSDSYQKTFGDIEILAEHQGILDFIFMDGFESGDLTGWSEATPSSKSDL